MSGIAALAAAAAATQKITTTVAAPTSISGIKVVTPTIVTPSGIKVTPVPGRTGINHVRCLRHLYFIELLNLDCTRAVIY
jgi:hypothetical protein